MSKSVSVLSARERPEPVGLPAGDALDLPLIGAERERIDHMAAHSAFVVAEGRYGLDSAHQPAIRTLPDKRHAVAELAERKLQRLHRGLPVAPIQSCFKIVKVKLRSL